MEKVEPEVVNCISLALDKELGSVGFEFHPFKVGWYNSIVQPIFHLDYHEDTLAFLIISSPKMFEDGFIPYLQRTGKQLSGLKDPIDECMMFYLSKVKDIFPCESVKVVHDFELHPNRRPKIVLQSVAHASGAAYFYHERDLIEKNEAKWKNKKNPNYGHSQMYGVCVHPKYGGWFALRAVAFFENIQCSKLPRTFPPDVVPSQEDRIKLLELYNLQWEDWKFRDIFPVKEKYSDLQKKYFSTPPGNRMKIIEEILSDSGD